MDRDILTHGAAFCIGVTAFAFGVPGAAMATTLSGSAFTSVSFARLWNGRQELRQVEAAQAECRAGYLELARREAGVAEIEAMDAFLDRAISAVEITRSEMETLVPGGDFVRGATDLLMARMKVDASGHTDFARRYARDLIETGLRQALTREAFLRTLQLEAVFSIQREVEGLHDKVDGLDAKIRNEVPRSLLESLVQRFEHDNPDAPVPVLEAFLKDKAKEWKAQKARLATLEAGNARLADVRAGAEAALERGDFDAARTLLDGAAEIGTDAAVEKLREVADIHAVTAETWLLQGDADAAAASFETGAMLFTGVDRMEEAQRRRDGAMRLAYHGARFGGTGLARATDLNERNLDVYEEIDKPLLLAESCQITGDLLRQQAVLKQEPEVSDLINKSDTFLRKVFNVFEIDKFPVGWASNRVFVGNNLALRASLSANQEFVSINNNKVILEFESALRVPSFYSTSVKFASCQNGLGNALHDMARVAPIYKRASWLQRAAAAYKAALIIWTETDFPEEWARTENNLANSRRQLAELDPGPAGTSLLRKAVRALRLTLKVRTLEDYPLAWAATKNNLGSAAATLAERLDASAGFDLLVEAGDSFSDSQTVYTRESYPSRYATAEANIGRTKEKIGDNDPVERAARYAEALASYDLALEVFGPNDRGPYRALCMRNRKGLMEKLAALG